MPEPPRRTRIQIHLSTAIVFMFVAGGLMWMNFSPKQIMVFRSGNPSLKLNADGQQVRNVIRVPYWQEYGWPMLAHGREYEYSMGKPYREDIFWIQQGLIVDSSVAIAILFAVWFTCELLIRRSTAQKEP